MKQSQTGIKKQTMRACSLALISCLLLTSCTLPRSNQNPELRAKTSKPEMPEKILLKDDTDPIMNIQLGDDMLVPTPLESSDALPDVYIDNFSAVDATAVEAFRLLMMDRGVAVSADDSANDVRVNITDYSGKLQDVTERLSETAGVFYTYKKGLLRLSKDRSFIVPLPPVADALEEMASVITSLGAADVKLDKSSRLITFRATRKAFDSVSSYLDRLRKQKVMIVYETYFLEVTLNDAKSTGINWNPINRTSSSADTGTGGTGGTGGTSNNLNDQQLATINSLLSLDSALGDGSPALSAISSGTGMAFGTLFTSGSLNVNVLFDFLSEQGNVETLSKPVITMMSGSKSKFEVGRKIRFVSRRGVATTEGVSTTQATFETEDLSTGLKVELLGDYSDDTVYTSINLTLDDLIRFTDPAPGTANSIQLPETATRTLSTNVRVRPGDAILIAGINQTRDRRYNAGPWSFENFMPFLRSREENVDRSELVIVLKPRVVGFNRDAVKMAIKSGKDLKDVVVPNEKIVVGPSTVAPMPDVVNMPLVGTGTAGAPPSMPMSGDPNLNSQMIFRSTGAPVSPALPLPAQNAPSWGESSSAMPPLQPPVDAGSDRNDWSHSYNSQPMLSYPPEPLVATPPAPVRDTYSQSMKDRPRLPAPTQMQAPDSDIMSVPSSRNGQTADPYADSFGYYGQGGVRQ